MGNKSETKANRENKAKKKDAKEQTVDVLYQRLGDRWYAFSMIDDEVFVGSISQSEIEPGVKRPVVQK
jgi:hypothetical protein